MEELLKPQERQEEYAFLGMRFFPNKWQIEIRENENPVTLTKVQREFLLALLKNANQPVTYEDLRLAVWNHEPEVDRRLIHNMHVTKSKLTGLLDSQGIDSSFIESIDGEGYKLNAEVDFIPAYHEKSETDSNTVFNKHSGVNSEYGTTPFSGTN